MEQPENYSDIPIEKKVQFMGLAANLMKVRMTEKDCEVFIAVYEQLCEIGLSMRLEDIVKIKEDVEQGIKTRTEEKKMDKAKELGVKKGGVEKTWIEKNIDRVSKQAHGRA